MRNCCKYVVYKALKAFTVDMKEICSAPNRDLAASALDRLRKYGAKALICGQDLAKQLGRPPLSALQLWAAEKPTYNTLANQNFWTFKLTASQTLSNYHLSLHAQHISF